MEEQLSDNYLDERYKRWYADKNRYLRENHAFEEIDTGTFLRLLFCRGDNFDSLPFEKEWCESYEWWTEHRNSCKRPANFHYVYNGIAQAIYGDNDKRNRSYVITSQAERLMDIKSNPFVILSPISYTGKRRLKSNARYLYAMVIDIDDVDGKNLENLVALSDPTRPRRTFPQPNIIVNSGGGVHIYYLLENPVPMFSNTYKILNKIKKELTRRVWNKYTTHLNQDRPQIQGNCQGFRMPGTQTKLHDTVTAFRNVNPNAKLYYKVEELVYGGGGFLTDEEEALLKAGKYNPCRVTLKEARELWPEWYERRIIQNHRRGRWYIKRDLYDWWKKKVYEKAEVGHRYFCLMALAIYARKCNISEDEFNADVKELTKFLDDISYTDDLENRFTWHDAECAMRAYKDDYCTFPLEDIRDITGIEIERNRTRKFKNQNTHLEEARAVRDVRQKREGKVWNENNGRKNKYSLIQSWKTEHPDGTKYACAKELGIDRKTVRKWWSNTPEKIAEEKRVLAMTEKKVAALDENSRKIYEWKVAHSMWPQLSTAMENAAKELSIPKETVQELWNSVDSLYYDPDMVNNLTTSKDFVSLTKLFEPGSNYRVEGYTHKQTVNIVTSGKWEAMGWKIVME